VPIEPSGWLPPWQCSHCHGLYGYGESGTFRIDAGFRPLWPLYSWIEMSRFGHFSPGFHYVYAICYQNGLPFYVGKGSGLRPLAHVDEAYSENAKAIANHEEKHRILRSLNNMVGPNHGELYHIFGVFDREPDAYALEASIINRWGIRSSGGLLANLVVPDSRGFIAVGNPVELGGSYNERDGARLVHHCAHDKIAVGGKFKHDFCPICKMDILIPEELFHDKVNCPHCAGHFVASICYAKPREFRDNIGAHRSPKVKLRADR
jgi:hypothetical protein